MHCLRVYFVLNFVLKTQIFEKMFYNILGLDLDSQQKMALILTIINNGIDPDC